MVYNWFKNLKVNDFVHVLSIILEIKFNIFIYNLKFT